MANIRDIADDDELETKKPNDHFGIYAALVLFLGLVIVIIGPMWAKIVAVLAMLAVVFLFIANKKNMKIREGILSSASTQSETKEEEEEPRNGGGIDISDIQEAPIEESVLFPLGVWTWLVMLVSWILFGYYISNNYNKLVFIGYAILFIGWLSKAANIIREDEKAESIFLGKIIKMIGSGLTLTVYPFETLRRYPTGVQQLEMATAGIQTKREILEIKNGAGKVLEKITISEIILPVTPIFNFQWPWTHEDLVTAIRNAPRPDNLKELINRIEEALLDIVRTAGGQKNYLWLQQNRVPFAEEVTALLKQHKDLAGMINLFRLKNVTVSFKHIDLPAAIKAAQEAEAASRHTGTAQRTVEREKRIGIGEGDRYIREALASMLTDKRFRSIGLNLEAMITLREMARDGKTTYALVPQAVYGVLSKALGGPADQAIGALSEQEFKELLELGRKFKEGGIK